MNYSKLVKTYQAARQFENPEKVTLKQAKTEVDCFMNALYTGLCMDNQVDLYGVGIIKLERRDLPARERYIPTSGEFVEVPEKTVLKSFFKPCPALKEAVL